MFFQIKRETRVFVVYRRKTRLWFDFYPNFSIKATYLENCVFLVWWGLLNQAQSTKIEKIVFDRFCKLPCIARNPILILMYKKHDFSRNLVFFEKYRQKSVEWSLQKYQKINAHHSNWKRVSSKSHNIEF